MDTLSLSTFDPAEISGELWDILPYAGLWIYTGPKRITQASESAVRSVRLTGLPYNPNGSQIIGTGPRIVNFLYSTLSGPISPLSTGIQSVFFSSALENTFTWTVKPVYDTFDLATFKIGFYAPNYLNGNLGYGQAIPMITDTVPAFYEGMSSGQFTVTRFNTFYVVTNADVVVEIVITYRAARRHITSSFYSGIPSRKYKVKGEVVATEVFIPINSILLRPTNKYLNLSKKMIGYLASKSVTINIVAPPVLYRNLGLGNNVIATYVPFSKPNTRPWHSSIVREYTTDTRNYPQRDPDGYTFIYTRGPRGALSAIVDLSVNLPSNVTKVRFSTMFFGFNPHGSNVIWDAKEVTLTRELTGPTSIETFAIGDGENVSIDNVGLMILEIREDSSINDPPAVITAAVFRIFPR